MVSPRISYDCSARHRRQALAHPADDQGNPIPPVVNGLDFLEVSPDQTSLSVHFIHPLPGQPGGVPNTAALTLDNVRIDGGVRIRGIRIVQIQAAAEVLRVQVDAPGDFSTYLFRLVSSATADAVPPGFDPQFAEIAFSFKVDCPSDFDCRAQTTCPPVRLASPDVNYLAKDYASFRRLILDRLSTLLPEWKERNPADLGIVLVEWLAHIGDLLSYFQDAVATEAYLGTARQRRSLRRHARLLDYPVHDGSNARVWVALEIAPGSDADGGSLPSGTILLTRDAGATATLHAADLAATLVSRPAVFETVAAASLTAARNAITFHTWSDAACCLPRGSTSATLRRDPDPSLEPGDVLVFEEVVHPGTGLEADARRAYRHAVRLTSVESTVDPLTQALVVNVAWAPPDALPFDLQVSAILTTGGGPPQVVQTAVARANILLADHGRTIPGEPLLPALAPGDEPYRPRLARRDLVFHVPFDPNAARSVSATDSLRQEPHSAVPSIRLFDGRQDWIPRRDLLASDRFAPEFVVETEVDGTAFLRFGDDLLARRPAAGTAFEATYRIGRGRDGHVGPDAIGRVVTDFTGITRVWNPLSSSGGEDPETLEQIRVAAPQAFRRQERAVTEADWVEVTERHPEIQRAAATFRWTGSWYTVFVTVDRVGGRDVDDAFREELRVFLERYRLADYDLEVNGPIFVPLDLGLTICVSPGFFRSDVEESLRLALGSGDRPDGSRGFFHADNFTFGQPLFLSQLIQAVTAVEGVASIAVDRFQRWRLQPAGELERGYLEVDRLEIIRCDNDPNFPENGRIEFNLHGGL